MGHQPRTQEDEEKVEAYVEAYVHQLEGYEAEGTAPIAQIAVRNGEEGVDSHAQRHDGHIFGMTVAAHPVCHRPQSRQDADEEHRRAHGKRYQAGAVHLGGIFPPLMICKAEKTRFEAVDEHHHHHSHHGVYIRYHAVLLHGEHNRVEGHQQPVEKAAHDRAYAVDGSVLYQTLYTCHIFSS